MPPIAAATSMAGFAKVQPMLSLENRNLLLTTRCPRLAAKATIRETGP
jgi:hypothetical protein